VLPSRASERHYAPGPVLCQARATTYCGATLGQSQDVVNSVEKRPAAVRTRRAAPRPLVNGGTYFVGRAQHVRIADSAITLRGPRGKNREEGWRGRSLITTSPRLWQVLEAGFASPTGVSGKRGQIVAAGCLSKRSATEKARSRRPSQPPRCLFGCPLLPSGGSEGHRLAAALRLRYRLCSTAAIVAALSARVCAKRRLRSVIAC
jgi:hypothetical protein